MSLAQVTTRQYPLHKWASRSQACPFRGHPPETPGDSQRSFSQCSSASYAPHPHRAEPPRKQSALGSEFLGPFCTFAHGVTTRGRISEDGAGRRALGETTRHLWSTAEDREQGWAMPPSDHLQLLPTFHTDKDWRINPPHPYCQSRHSHMVYQCQPRGSPPGGPSHLLHQHCLASKCE